MSSHLESLLGTADPAEQVTLVERMQQQIQETPLVIMVSYFPGERRTVVQPLLRGLSFDAVYEILNLAEREIRRQERESWSEQRSDT